MKRGEISAPAEMIITIVLLVLAFMIVFAWGISQGWWFTKNVEREICAVTLTAQQIAKTGTSLGFAPSPLRTRCERRFIEIGEDHAQLVYPGKKAMFIRRASDDFALYIKDNSGVLKPSTNYGNLHTDTVYSAFAESMRSCWYLSNGGQSPVINNPDAFLLSGVDRICVVCDQIDLQVPPDDHPTESLRDYLNATVMPRDPQNRTYSEYLFPNVALPLPGLTNDKIIVGDQCIRDNSVTENPRLEPGLYATVLFRDFNTLSDDCMNTYVLPAAELTSLCDEIAN